VSVENRSGQYEFSSDPELENLFQVWARKIGLAIRTATVGTVVSYNPATQEATIRVDHLEVKRVTQQTVPGEDPNETNEVRASAPIQLTSVPVAFFGAGNGSSYLTFPITPGCTGMLAVLDRSRDTWVTRTASVAVDPVKSAIHSLSDCVFFPGLTPKAQRISPSASITAAVLEAPQIKLGANAVMSVALADALVAAVDAMLAAGIAFVGVPADPSGENAGAAFAAAQGAWAALKDQIAALKVTAE
jgi:hypothetical protein